MFTKSVLVLSIYFLLLFSGLSPALSSSCESKFAQLVFSTSDYLARDPISYESNLSYIRYVESRGKGIYFNVENAVLKELNDKVVKNKDLVTSLDNYYKQELLHAIESDPMLSHNLKYKYNDFKSIRFVFSENTPEVKQHLELAYRFANEKFSEIVSRQGISFDSARGLSANPKTWHLAGLGSSMDESSLASREARSAHPNAGNIVIQDFVGAKEFLTKTFENISLRRNYLEQWFKNVPALMEKSPTGKYVLSADTIKLMKSLKLTDESREAYVRALQESFAKNFGIHINQDQAIILRDYLGDVDRFSPSLLIAKRTVIDLRVAKEGIVSVDFAGQNARNLEKMMEHMADADGHDIQSVMNEVRKSEESATKILDSKKSYIKQGLSKYLGQGETHFSGDDGVFFPAQQMNNSEKEKFLHQVYLGHQDPSTFRITFLPKHYRGTQHDILAEERSDLIVIAEGIEKELRTRLEGSIPITEKHDMLFAVDLDPIMNNDNHVVNLFTAGVSEKWKKIINDTFSKILQEKAYQKNQIIHLHD